MLQTALTAANDRAIAEPLPHVAVHKALKRNRLFDRVIIWRARREHPLMTAGDIAELLHVPIPTVRRALKQLSVTPKEMLQATEYEAVTAWRKAIPKAASKGDHRPAKDLLLHTRAIEPVQHEQTHTVNVLIASLSLPGLGSQSPDVSNVIDVIAKDSADIPNGVNGV